MILLVVWATVYTPSRKTILKWTSAVKRQRVNWGGPSSSSLLCSKHFKEDCFVTEGVRYHDELGVLAQKRLKPDAVPTIFARSTDYQNTGSNTSTLFGRQLSERREQKSASLYVTCIPNSLYIIYSSI